MKHFWLGISLLLLTSQLQANSQVNAYLHPVDNSQPIALPGAVLLVHPQFPVESANFPSVSVIQRNQQFSPYITAVYQGTAVMFPNQDTTAHHVYSFSAAKAFELPLYKGQKQPEPVLFDKSGVVVLGCNIHDWMLAYIYVADTPYFAQMQSNKATFSELPVGSYQVSLWHPDIHSKEKLTKTIVIGQDTKAVDVIFKLTRPLKVRKQPQAPDNNLDRQNAY